MQRCIPKETLKSPEFSYSARRGANFYGDAQCIFQRSILSNDISGWLLRVASLDSLNDWHDKSAMQSDGDPSISQTSEKPCAFCSSILLIDGKNCNVCEVLMFHSSLIHNS